MPRLPPSSEEMEQRAKDLKRIATLKPLQALRHIATFTNSSAQNVRDFKAMNRYYLHNLPRYMAKRKASFVVTEDEKRAMQDLVLLYDELGRGLGKHSFVPFGILSRLLMLEHTTGDSLRREHKQLVDAKKIETQKIKTPSTDEMKKYVILTARIAKSMLQEYDAGMGNVFKLRREMRARPWEEGVPRMADPEYFAVPEYPKGNFHLPEKNVRVGFRFFTNEHLRANEALFCSVCNASMRYGDLFSVGKLYNCNELKETTLIRAPDYAHWECCCPQYDRLIDFQRNYLKIAFKDVQGFDELDEETQDFYNNIRYSVVTQGRGLLGGKRKKKKDDDDDD